MVSGERIATPSPSPWRRSVPDANFGCVSPPVALAAGDPLAPLLALPGVGDAVERSRLAVDAMVAHRTLRRRSSQVSAESALRGAWAAARLAGAGVELDAVRAGDVAEPRLQGSLRAYASLGALADTWTRAPRQALARLHVLAAADLVADRDTLGRPTGAAASSRLDVLASVLAATRAPALVVAAVVAGDVLVLDAFAPASVVVAHAALRLTLVERGLDPRSLAVPEVGALESAGERAAALAGFRAGTPEGVAGWIGHVGDTLVLGARETVAICEAMGR